MDNEESFVFHTERRMVILTGKSARNLAELLDHIRQVSGSSIFYHTHQQYLSHHFEKPVFHNDFASWVSLALLEEPLSEKLAAIDLLAFSSLRELREAIVGTIEAYLTKVGGRMQNCLPGQEFHFCESKSFIMPSGLVARDIPDFFAKLPKAANTSLYFHFFEARLRLERPTNDFSTWLYYRGAEKLAQAIDKLNPYRMTMEELREEIIKLGSSGRLTYGCNTA
jgi:hypothetical protein